MGSMLPGERKVRNGGMQDGFHGYCDSRACCAPKRHVIGSGKAYYKSKRWAIKNVKPGTMECPDCKSILYWKKI